MHGDSRARNACGSCEPLSGTPDDSCGAGRLIPAGTGLPAYKMLNVIVEGHDSGYVPEREPAPIPRAPESLAVNEE